MAKKKNETGSARHFEYEKMIREMSDEAFELCVKHLYPHLGYRVMKCKEIRRVDLIEKLFDLEQQIPYSFSEKHTGMMDYYLFALQQYFEKVISCKEGTRAEKYKSKALGLIKQVDTTDLSSVDDIFLIFISIVRVFYQNANLTCLKTSIAVKPSFTVTEEDADILKVLWDSKDLVPEILRDKKGLIEKRGMQAEKIIMMRLMYFNNIVFLARALDNFGGFEVVENNG